MYDLYTTRGHYSGLFYRHAFRILRREGHIFHYIGNLESKSGGRVLRGVVRPLKEAIFSRVASGPRLSDLWRIKV
jgi:predicted methyltransferase